MAWYLAGFHQQHQHQRIQPQLLWKERYYHCLFVTLYLRSFQREIILHAPMLLLDCDLCTEHNIGNGNISLSHCSYVLWSWCLLRYQCELFCQLHKPRYKRPLPDVLCTGADRRLHQGRPSDEDTPVQK